MKPTLVRNAISALTLAAGMALVAITAHAQAIKITNGPRVEGTTEHTATVAWSTNTRGSSIVHYGTSPNALNQTAESPYTKQGQTHRVEIKGLKPSTTYYFKVDSGQGFGTGTDITSGETKFTTKSASAANNSEAAEKNEKPEAVKIVDGPRVEGTTANSATIAWTTNEASSSVIHYGTNRNALNETAEAPYADAEGANHQTHRVQVKNLKPNTTYYYQVESGQGEGTGTKAGSSVTQFKTK